MERCNVIFRKDSQEIDLDIPLDISANDLVSALNTIYDLKLDISDSKNCFLKSEAPIALLKGSKLLKDFGIREGSVISYYLKR